MRVEDFEPAFAAVIARRRRAIDAIVGTRAPATFANTVIALERSGRALERVLALYHVSSNSLCTAAVQTLERELEPRLAAFDDELVQNRDLFVRIEAVHEAQQDLSPEQRRLTWQYHSWFIKHGALLDPPAKRRVTEINRLLAALSTQFSQNLLADEQRHALTVTDPAELAGLTPSDIDAARAEAARSGAPQGWVFPNTRSAIETLLTRANQRPLRERAWRSWIQRCDNGDKFDNNAIVTKILALRAERARLLGFRSYAHWKLSNKMAADPQAALDLMLRVWSPAVEQVKRDIAAMQQLADAENSTFTIAPWDYRYYAEKLRQAHYDLGLDEIKPYLQLDRVREAMFWVGYRLFGLRFQPLTGVPVFHPDVSVYEALDPAGERAGVWYFDPYARTGKRSGAWMSTYRTQARLDGTETAIVSNNLNLVAPRSGEITYVSWNDAITMFHEFGHALHAITSNVTYPSLASPHTLDDFGEFPSQLIEHWLAAPEVLARLTNVAGEPMPRGLFDKIVRAKAFNQGFIQTEYLASAIMDMKLHLEGDAEIHPRAFELTTLTDLGMPREIVMRHRIPHFSHVFSGEAYAAGYYDYLWAAVLEHDAFEAFFEAGDLFDPVVAERLKATIFAVGNTIDPGQAFRNFRGRDPQATALLLAKGFLARAPVSAR